MANNTQAQAVPATPEAMKEALETALEAAPTPKPEHVGPAPKMEQAEFIAELAGRLPAGSKPRLYSTSRILDGGQAEQYRKAKAVPLAIVDSAASFRKGRVESIRLSIPVGREVLGAGLGAIIAPNGETVGGRIKFDLADGNEMRHRDQDGRVFARTYIRTIVIETIPETDEEGRPIVDAEYLNLIMASRSEHADDVREAVNFLRSGA